MVNPDPNPAENLGDLPIIEGAIITTESPKENAEDKPLSFVDWLKQAQLSDRTIKEYSYYLRRFGAKTYNTNSVNNFLKLNSSRVARAFLNNLKNYLIESPISDEDKQTIQSVYIKKIRGDKTVHKVKTVITFEEFKKLHYGIKDFRLRVMVDLAYFGALRSFELISINATNFNWLDWKKDEEQSGILTIKGKRNKTRSVLIPNFIMQEVRLYFAKRYERQGIDLEVNIWTMSYKYFWDKIQQAGLKHLGKKFGTHTFRRSFATHLFEQGWDIIEIKEFLGHKDISTTAIYTQISKRHLEDKYKQVTDNSLS